MQSNRGSFSCFIPIKCSSGNNNIEKAEFIENTKQYFQSQKPHFDFKCRLRVDVVFHYTGSCNFDIDNLLKTTLDSMEGIAYENDSDIKEITAKILDNSFIEGVSIKIDKIR